jgi:hypothetical protein
MYQTPPSAVMGSSCVRNDVTAADNYVSNNDAVMAAVPEEQNSDNALLIEPFDDSFFEAPDPEIPSKKLPTWLAFRCPIGTSVAWSNASNMATTSPCKVNLDREGEYGYHYRHCCKHFGGRSQRRLVVAP